MIVVLSYVLWQVLLWALAPGFWAGSWIGGHGDSPLIEAKEHFGPILLVKWWIREPAGSIGNKKDVLELWGKHESAARLLLIISVLWVVICATIMFPRIKRALQGCQKRSEAGERINVPESKP